MITTAVDGRTAPAVCAFRRILGQGIGGHAGWWCTCCGTVVVDMDAHTRSCWVAAAGACASCDGCELCDGPGAGTAGQHDPAAVAIAAVRADLAGLAHDMPWAGADNGTA